MKTAVIAFVLALAVLAGTFSAAGQELYVSGDILIGNTVVFRVRGPSGGYSVAERVAIINRRINDVLSELQAGKQLTLASVAR